MVALSAHCWSWTSSQISHLWTISWAQCFHGRCQQLPPSAPVTVLKRFTLSVSPFKQKLQTGPTLATISDHYHFNFVFFFPQQWCDKIICVYLCFCLSASKITSKVLAHIVLIFSPQINKRTWKIQQNFGDFWKSGNVFIYLSPGQPLPHALVKL